jgi:hypothetical protein
MLNESHYKKSENKFRYATAEEEACFQRQGVADYALMVRVLQQLKVHGCLLHRQLSFGSPRARTRFPIILRKRGVHDGLQRAVADTRAHIETISIDCLLHGDSGDVLRGCKDGHMENFASIRDTAMTRRLSGTVSIHAGASTVDETRIVRCLLERSI